MYFCTRIPQNYFPLDSNETIPDKVILVSLVECHSGHVIFLVLLIRQHRNVLAPMHTSSFLEKLSLKHEFLQKPMNDTSV